MIRDDADIFEAPFENQRFFLGQLLIAAGLAWIGYELGNKGQALDERMKEANKHLASIADSAKRIADAAVELVDLVKHLPEAIAAVLEERDITTAISEALSQGQRLTDLISTEELIKNYAQEIDSRLFEMMKAINLVVKIRRGISGLVLMAPHVGVYGQVNDIFQRWRLKNPTLYKPYINPLSSAFHVGTIAATWQKALDWDDSFYRTYGQWWQRTLRPARFPGEPSVPGAFAKAWEFDRAKGEFVRTNISYNERKANTFGVTPLPVFTGGFVNLPDGILVSPRSVTPNLPFTLWAPISQDGQGHPDPEHVAAAQRFLDSGPPWPLAKTLDYVEQWSSQLPAVRTKLATTLFLPAAEWPGLHTP